MSYEGFNTSDEPSSPSVGSSTIPIDMEEVNPTQNMEIIGLEGMEDDVGKDVELVEKLKKWKEIDDWQKVEEICPLLVHFNEVTKTISDPRNKMPFIEFAFPVIYYEHEATRQIAIVRDALNGLYRIYLDKHATVSNQSMDNDSQARNTSEKKGVTLSWKGKGLDVQTGRAKFEKFV
nr:zinc finger BED domain-containing protein RICESLEEPER 2-like [Ipomoea trifida]